MKIRPKIPMLLGGNNIWYNGILDYDPTRYVHAYDTSRLVNPLNFGEAWASRINGNGRGRYIPNPTLSRDLVRNIEQNNNYYRRFTDALFNTDGTLSDVGKTYARLSDDLLPENSLARVYNGDQMRTNWITTNSDTYGRPGNTFNNVRDYLRYERNDNLPGGRHNVFLDKGKRYFYVDNEGKYHWVSPEDATKYLISEKPIEYGWGDDGVYWEDYELTGLKSPNNSLDQKLQVPDKLQVTNEIEVGVGDDDKEEKTVGFDWNKIKGSLLKSIPGIIEGVRLVGNHIANEKIYGEALKGIRPDLMQSYNTYRQVVGDEATKQGYYRRAIQGLTKAARPFTSDADKQMAYLFEAKRVGDELKAQGDLADNLRIRETAELSSQHLDANRQRATEVANANNKAINYANSLKHNLLALKHAALWSSVDNYLQGLANEYKANNERNKLWNLLAWLLLREGEIENDKKLEYLRKLFDIAAAKPLNLKLDSFGLKVVNYDSDEIKGLVQKIKNRNRELQFETFLQKRTLIGKSGTKLTVKKKEKNDLLYKSTRDTVEHFRKMSKMSSDAQNRKRIKIDKLAPHPKGTKKYQQGGLAPFLVYKPTILGGETTTTTQTDSSSSKSSKSSSSTDLEIDLLKDLFKNLAVEGLPSDTNIIYSSMMELMNRRKLFGNSLSSSDIESMYIHLLEKINTIKYNKAQFDKVSEIVHNKNADSEIAIDSLGRIAVQNLENKEVEYKRLEDLEKGKYVPLTNKLLLDLRAISPNMAFDSGLALQTAANATSMLEIAKFLKEQLPSIESSENVIEGYTKKESNNIKEGLRQLLYDAPEGDYKYTITNKNNSEQIKSALGYLKNVLPNNMKNYLEIKSGGKNPDKLIVDLLSSKFESTLKTEFLAVTGKASSSSSKTGGSGEGSDITPAIALSMGLGERETFVISDKTSDGLKVSAVNLPLLDENHHAMAVATLQLVGSGDYAGLLQLNSATMGGVKISPEGINNILISEGRIHAAELPIDMLEYQNTGIIKPNLGFLKNIEKADELIKLLGITNRDNLTAELIKIINDIYTRNNLPIIYTIDSKGKPILTSEYRRFALMKATAPKDSFDEELDFNDGVMEATDDDRTRFEAMMKLVTKNNKYSLDNGLSIPGIGRFGGTNLYKGTIYIPMTESHISALASTGYKASPEEYNLIDALDQQALFIKSSGFKSAGSFTK